jgi:hypothetical protein
MKKLVWVAGLLLIVALLYPNGISLPTPSPEPVPVPAPDDVVDTNPEIVSLLANATAEDKQRIAGTYEGMLRVFTRDKGTRVKTTEQWADFQANTLQLAIDTPGKYPGLDVAIENVFKTQLGTDDVLPTNPETQQQINKACRIIIASARK